MQGIGHTPIGRDANVRPVRCKDQDIHHPQGQAQGQRRGVRVFVIDRRRRRQDRRRILSVRQAQAPVRRPYRKACVVACAVNQTVAVIPPPGRRY